MRATPVVLLLAGLASAALLGAWLAGRPPAVPAAPNPRVLDDADAAPSRPTSVPGARPAFPRGDPEKGEVWLPRARSDLESARAAALAGNRAAREGLADGALAVAEGRPSIVTGGMPLPDFTGVDPDTGLWFAHRGCNLGSGFSDYARAHNAVVVVAVFGAEPVPAGAR